LDLGRHHAAVAGSSHILPDDNLSLTTQVWEALPWQAA
jgi:hypothetical protein